MIGNADDKTVLRDIEGHGAAMAIARGYKILVFHRKLITELVFAKECDLGGEQVTDTGHSFEGKVFCRVEFGIDYFKTRANPHIGLQAPEGDFLILKEAIASYQIGLQGPDRKPIRVGENISWASRYRRRYEPLISIDLMAGEAGLHFPTKPGVGIKIPSEFYACQYPWCIVDIFGRPARILSRTA